MVLGVVVGLMTTTPPRCLGISFLARSEFGIPEWGEKVRDDATRVGWARFPIARKGRLCPWVGEEAVYGDVSLVNK